MKKIICYGLILGSIVTYQSCILPYPDDAELYSDVATLTRYDSTENFGRFTTYAVSDTVFFIGSDTTLTAIEVQYSQQLVTEFVNQMNSRGYTRVDKTANPDLVVNMSATESLNIVYYPYYGYGYYGCGYWYYPCDWWYYPTYPTISSYTSGSLVIDLVDRKDAIEGDLGYLPIPWTSVVYALTESNPQFNVDKAITGIQNAFKQSPYLKH